jgi:hypothetical protein
MDHHECTISGGGGFFTIGSPLDLSFFYCPIVLFIFKKNTDPIWAMITQENMDILPSFLNETIAKGQNLVA